MRGWTLPYSCANLVSPACHVYYIFLNRGLLSFPFQKINVVPLLNKCYRYRLMLRRCLEFPTPQFGMIMPPRAAPTGSPTEGEYGTMLEIRSVQALPDGRSLVSTWGTFRFRILERGTLDGYTVARIER